MKELIKQILEKFTCKHEWSLEVEHYVTYNGVKTGVIRLFICKKCGKFKKIKLGY